MARTCAVIALAAALGAAASPATADLAEAQTLVDSAAAVFAEARSYTIEFTQENHWALADTVYIMDGTLTLDRPSRLSIRYGDGGRVAVDGESLRVYVPQTNQFFVTETGDSDLLIDPATLLREYAPDPARPFAEPRDERSTTVRLLPVGESVEPARIHVSFDREGGALRTIEAFSTSDDRTVYRIRSVNLDVSVSDGEFRLEAPPGVERITGSPFSAE